MGLAAVAAVALATAATPASGQSVMYRLQERIQIPVSSAAGNVSRKPLALGKTYLLRVTGTAYTGEGTGVGYGDAEYVENGRNGHVIDRCRDGTDLGVAVDDENVSPGHRKHPHWGRYSSKHTYSLRMAGTGARIRVDYHDCGYDDNHYVSQFGTTPLTLSVYAPEP